jgi:hypothetical protein
LQDAACRDWKGPFQQASNRADSVARQARVRQDEHKTDRPFLRGRQHLPLYLACAYLRLEIHESALYFDLH